MSSMLTKSLDFLDKDEKFAWAHTHWSLIASQVIFIHWSAEETWKIVSQAWGKVSKLNLGFPSSKSYLPPNSCIPKTANIEMTRKKKEKRLSMESQEERSLKTTVEWPWLFFPRPLTYLQCDINKFKLWKPCQYNKTRSNCVDGGYKNYMSRQILERRIFLGSILVTIPASESEIQNKGTESARYPMLTNCMLDDLDGKSESIPQAYIIKAGA